MAWYGSVKLIQRRHTYRTTDVRLTDAQAQVAASIIRGLTNIEIAKERRTSTAAVKFLITDLYAKARVSSRSQFIVAWAKGDLPKLVQRQLPGSKRARERAMAGQLPRGQA